MRSISGHQTTFLSLGWSLCFTPPGAINTPAELEEAGLSWISATVPSTAASALRTAGLWNLDAPPHRFDAEDVWYCTHFETAPAAPDEQLFLCFDGLATIAEVWLNGELLLSSHDMFVAHEVPLPAGCHSGNLAICFRSLDAALKQRRPRPRWRAPMVENQQLRWWRTTLLGRTPGWSPPAAPVGPWREIRLERRIFHIDGVKLITRLEDNTGYLEIEACLIPLSGEISGAEVVLERNGENWRAPLQIEGELTAGHLIVPDVEKWWPHTHGEPTLYTARLLLHHTLGSIEIDLGEIGFRTVELNTESNNFALRINGVPVFCRGACWTPLDVVSLNASPEEIETAVVQARDAGMNMLRQAGPLVDETDAFYDACDRHGILLWHDFLFANLDYPDETEFSETVRTEARQLLTRLTGRPSLVVLCGNSEVEQQSAMWGASRELWQPRLFHEVLPELANELCPDVPYWPSSAHGGAFPHQANSGTTSYYGVGAYLRPLEDARRSGLLFASECLAFANIPDETNLAAMPGGHANKVHHANWKARSPRDLGAGWDFDDVRDHYLQELFKLDPIALRRTDHDRYLEIGRVTTGEVMAAAFAEWRTGRSATNGALVWFLRDLWPGAGWGVVDSQGRLKAAWHYLRRVFSPLVVSLSDEGQSGLSIHLINEKPDAFKGEVEVTFYRGGETSVGSGRRILTLPPHSTQEFNAGELLEGFVDASYAYRFGPPPHDLVVATLSDLSGAVRSQAFFFPVGLPSTRQRDLGLKGEARPLDEEIWILEVQSLAFAQSVFIEIEGFEPSDNYFHVAPGGQRDIILHRSGPGGTPNGNLRAVNGENSSFIVATP